MNRPVEAIWNEFCYMLRGPGFAKLTAREKNLTQLAFHAGVVLLYKELDRQRMNTEFERVLLRDMAEATSRLQTQGWFRD